jgi:hypothetical protein
MGEPYFLTGFSADMACMSNGYGCGYGPIDWEFFKLFSMSGHATTHPSSMDTNTNFEIFLDDAIRDSRTKIEKGAEENDSSLRYPLFLTEIYLHWASTYYSHEIGHRQQYYNRGIYQLGVPLGSVWTPLVPKWDHKGDGNAFLTFDPYSHSRNTLGGLYQQELNSEYYFRKGVIDGDFDLDDAFAYLFNNAADVAYHVVFGPSFGDIRNTKKNYEHDFQKNINTDNWFALSVLTAMASARMWESLFLMEEYLRTGKAEARPLRIEVGGVAVYPPHISFFVGPLDYFMNIELPLKAKEYALFLNFGATLRDVARPARPGARLFVPPVEVSAFVDLDSGGYVGGAYGLKADAFDADGWKLSVAFLWHEGDYVFEDLFGYGLAHTYCEVCKCPPYETVREWQDNGSVLYNSPEWDEWHPEFIEKIERSAQRYFFISALKNF